MISYILELLRDKPEQEQLLLRLLVNKLVWSWWVVLILG